MNRCKGCDVWLGWYILGVVRLGVGGNNEWGLDGWSGGLRSRCWKDFVGFCVL